MSSNSNTSNGVSLGTVLFLIFLMLKLTDKIDWSWWWVTSPLWAPITAVVLICIRGIYRYIVRWRNYGNGPLERESTGSNPVLTTKN